MDGLDRKTRGRTAPQRLQALDAYVVHLEQVLVLQTGIGWEDAAFVDVGFGEYPWTTLESALAFRALNPDLRVIGVDRDPQRVALARVYENARTSFRQGGFELPLAPGESARLLRAMNLLRTYPEAAVLRAHEALGASLCEEGLLLEGSSDTSGGVLVAHLLRREGGGLRREALLFHTDFSHGFAPLLFRDWLPRDLRRRVKSGEPIQAFFSAWTDAWKAAREDGAASPREAFSASVERLSESLPGVDLHPWLRTEGYLVWRPPGGVPP